VEVMITSPHLVEFWPFLESEIVHNATDGTEFGSTSNNI